MKIIYRVLAGVLTAALLVPNLAPVVQADAPKVSADEAVYVNLDYYGKTNEVNIVKGCSLNGNGQFTDYGAYSKVTNMTDESKPTITGDSVNWNLPETTGRFYYECTPKDGAVTLPWNFDVSYKLDGVPTDAKKLAGASGLVEINVKATPNKNASEYDKNNMLLQVGTAVKMKDTLSVEAPGAQLQSVGDYKAVLFAGLPGEEKTFTIRIGTKSFESMGVVMMMVPGTLEQLKDIKNIKEGKDTVQGSMDTISQSTNEILGTLQSMSSGLQQAQSGLSSLDNARNSISSSKGGLYGNADKSLADLTSITTQTSALVPRLQDAQKMVGDVNMSLNAIAVKVNTLSTGMASLSTSIGKVQKDVNDLRDNLDDMKGNSSARRNVTTRLTADLGAVDLDAAQLKGGMAALSTAQNQLQIDLASTDKDTKIPTGLAGVLGILAKYGKASSDSDLDATIKNISKQSSQTLVSLATVTGTNAAITNGVAGMLSQATQFTDTGRAAAKLLESYGSDLDSGLSTTDDLLKHANDTGSSLKSLLSTSQEVMDGITSLNGVMNQYKDGTVSALQDTQKLTVSLASGLTDAHDFLTSLETTMKTSGTSLDDGTQKSLSGLINVMEQSLNGIGKTSTIKNANNTIKKTIDDEINQYADDNNLLNLNADAKPVSFTSSKNASPESIQVILRTEEISIEKNDISTKDLETTAKDVGVFGRICSVFTKLWNAITSAFSS